MIPPSGSVQPINRPLTALLTHAIDYAGLFPPAKLDMPTAVRNYTTYRSGEYRWALGRFIVPVSRLAEFEQATLTTSGGGDESCPISALGGANPDKDVTAILDFNKHHVALIDSVEFKASTVDDVMAISRTVPSVPATFVEIPIDSDPTPLITMISRSGLRAKMRTGGITPDAFPSSVHIARFILACVHARVGFKATAGLHHALRGAYGLTNEPNSPSGMMYGFLNVFVGSCVAKLGGSIDEIKAALEETSPLEFQLGDQEIAWRQYRMSISGISSLRNELAISFGSCSFTEPMEDLKSLKLL